MSKNRKPAKVEGGAYTLGLRRQLTRDLGRERERLADERKQVQAREGRIAEIETSLRALGGAWTDALSTLSDSAKGAVADLVRMHPKGIRGPEILAALREARPFLPASSVYPALTQLEARGLIRKEGERRNFVYFPIEKSKPPAR